MADHDIDVVATQVKALADLVDSRIVQLSKDVAEIKLAIAKLSNGFGQVGIDGRELHRTVLKVDDHDQRIARLERVYWLQVGLYGLVAPLIVWFFIQLLSGKL